MTVKHTWTLNPNTLSKRLTCAQHLRRRKCSISITLTYLYIWSGGKIAMLRNSSPFGADKDVCVLQQPSQDQNQPTCDHFPTVMETTCQQASRRIQKPRWRHYLDHYIMSSSVVGTSPWLWGGGGHNLRKNTRGTGFAPKQNEPHSSQSPRRWLGEGRGGGSVHADSFWPNR